jgi:hypothetical protein
MHEPRESHYAMLAAFAPATLLARATDHAVRAGYLAHEFGDATLVLAGAAERPLKRSPRASSRPSDSARSARRAPPRAPAS